MYKTLFKKRKAALGFGLFTLVSVIVLFSGENSMVSRLTGAFGSHEEVAADESVAVETVHPAVIQEQPPVEEEQGFIDDEELVEDGEGSDPTPPEEDIGGEEAGDDSATADNGFNGEQVIVVNPGAPQAD